MTKQTDNHNLAAKLALRRHFMWKYHPAGARVFDAFQGGGQIWAGLRSEFALGSYWGVDLKPKKGRVKIESSRILNQPGWRFDVIDLDAYGLPWKHYRAALKFGPAEITIFLTVGSLTMGGSFVSADVAEIMGLTLKNIPPAIGGNVNKKFTDYCLGICYGFGYGVVESLEALNPGGNARYFGLHLKKQDTS